MSYESTAGDLNKATARPEDRVVAPGRKSGESLERTVLDDFKAQMKQLEMLQSRVTFMLKEVQGLIRR